MTNDIKAILDRLTIEETGEYSNHFYVIKLKNSDEYARVYSKLEKNAVNTEYPNFAVNTNSTTVGITNYFEVEEESTTYNIFLIADFDADVYKLKIGEK